MELNKDVLENINEEVLKIGGDAKSDSYKYNIDVLKDILSNVETIAGSGGAGLNIEIVEELPTTGESHTIYLVPNEGSKPNIYDEYMYIANDWEKIGSTEIDLTNYLAKNNTSEFTPTGDYNPATKKYVDDSMSSSSINYSTDEKLIGTWIDGKPLYQKTLVNTTFTSGSTILSVGQIQNVDTLFVVNGFYINQYVDFAPKGAVMMLTNTGRDTSITSYNSYVVFSSDSLIVYYGSTTASSKTVVTVQYTKTSD